MTHRRTGPPAGAPDPEPAPRRYPEHTPESMAREVEENPDVARELFADRFVAGFCVVCSDRAVLYATPVWFAPCRRCLARRMRVLLARRDDLPWWVSYLAQNCQRAVDLEDQKALAGPTVTFEPFEKCVACPKLVAPEDARYWFGRNNEFGGGFSYCVPCYVKLRARAFPKATCPPQPPPTCAGCRKPILPDDSAYWVGVEPDAHAGSAYCVPCYEVLLAEPQT